MFMGYFMQKRNILKEAGILLKHRAVSTAGFAKGFTKEGNHTESRYLRIYFYRDRILVPQSSPLWSLHFSGFSYIHKVVQPAPLSDSRTFSAPKETHTPYCHSLLTYPPSCSKKYFIYYLHGFSYSEYFLKME